MQCWDLVATKIKQQHNIRGNQVHSLAVRKNDIIAKTKKIPTRLQLAASAVTNAGVALPHPKVRVDQLLGGSL